MNLDPDSLFPDFLQGERPRTKRRNSDPDRGLWRRPSGLFMLRFSVIANPREVARRVVMSLETYDPEEARARKEIGLALVEKALARIAPEGARLVR